MKVINDLVSVIVPVYNTGIYLRKCLESILHQSHQNLELILIDDGSDDVDTLSIIDNYIDYDERIKYYRNSNMGVSRSRNFALSKCQGKYLCFVDSDDYIEPTMFEEMLKRLTNDNSDLAIAGAYNQTWCFRIPLNKLKDQTLNQKELFDGLAFNQNVNNYLWAKMFRRELFQDLNFDETLDSFEDVDLMPKIFAKVQKASIMKDYFYHHLKHHGSLTNAMDLNMANDMFIAFKKQEEYIKNQLQFFEFSNHHNYYRSEIIMLFTLIFSDLEVINTFTLPTYNLEKLSKSQTIFRELLHKLLKQRKEIKKP